MEFCMEAACTTKKWRQPQNEDNLKSEDNLKNEDDLKNEDALNNKDDLKNENDINNQDRTRPKLTHPKLCLLIRRTTTTTKNWMATLYVNTGLYNCTSPTWRTNNSKSNHPPLVIENRMKGRLSRISANKQVFDVSVHPHQKALIKSGYNQKLKYEPQSETSKTKKKRKKPVTC